MKNHVVTDWSPYAPYFKEDEFKCKHTGKCAMDKVFMDKLLELRKLCDFPFPVTSGFRDPTHPKERRKVNPGFHSKGIAVDIKVHSNLAWKIVFYAPQLGFRGIGVSQKQGRARFIHLDTRPPEVEPALYSY